MHTEELLDFCCEFGRRMTRCGGEIYRVEESITRILAAYGYRESEVFAIPSYVTVSVHADGRTYTHMVRIRDSATQLETLDQLNNLCRRICAAPMEISAARAEMDEIVRRPALPPAADYAMYGLAAMFFTLFWGGTVLDAAIALPVGLLTRLIVPRLRKTGANVFFLNVIAAAAQAVVPLLLAHAGLANHSDKVIIGALMLLVPGLAITNAMRDVIAGDFLTAVVRLAEVLIVSVAIALGIVIAIASCRMLPGIPPWVSLPDAAVHPVLQCLYAALSCFGFCGILGVRRGKYIAAACIAAGAAWAVYLAAAALPEAARYLIATAACALMAEICARIFRVPATVFLLVAIIPMVPGGGLYYTMEALLSGNQALCAQLGIQTGAAAAAIAVGASLVTSLMRICKPRGNCAQI